MHPPSIELLRALRLAVRQSPATNSFTSTYRVLTTHLHPLHQPIQPVSTLHHRKIHTSQPIQAQNPSNTPRRTPNIAASPSSSPSQTSSQSPSTRLNINAPKTRDRGPKSTEDTQTDFSALDIFNTQGITAPATSIDACTSDGFHLNNGVKTTGGHGVMLLGGEAFLWDPWKSSSPSVGTAENKQRISSLLSPRGIMSFDHSSWGVLELLYPKPDLLIIGTGAKLWMISKESRARLAELGVRVDVMDTPNAAAAYNLLATERGVDGVGAAFLPIGFRGL